VPLPGDLTTTVLTGTYMDAAGSPQQGRITFTPSADLTDATGEVVVPMSPRAYSLSRGEFTSDPLCATDNTTISPSGWTYSVVLYIAGLPPQAWSISLPHSGSPVDISTITPAVTQVPTTSALLSTGGSVSGTLTLNATPPLRIPTGAASGDVLTSDGSGNASWGPITAAELPAATSGAIGGVELGTDLGGTASAPHVVATHLASALPLAQGGTANTTGQPSGTASGDLGSSYPSPQVTSTHLASALPLAQGGTASTSRNFSGLLTQTATKTSAYAAAAGDFVCVDTTSGAVTITLPNAPADLTVVAVKMTASTATPNAVTIACAGSDVFNKTGGSTSATLTLLEQSSVFQYQHSTGIWLKQTGDIPLAQLDGRYANVFSPLAYGAKGNGTTDDTTAIQACAAAAASASGVVDLGIYTYKTTAPISVGNNFVLRGAQSTGSNPGGTIINAVSDIFRGQTYASHVTIEHVTLVGNGGASTGGHIINLIGSSCSFWKINGVFAIQNAYNYGILYLTGDDGGSTSNFPGGWLDCEIDGKCYFQANHNATVSPISLIRGATVNSVQIRSSRFGYDINGAAVPFLRIDPGFGAHSDSMTFSSGTPAVIGDTTAVASDIGMLIYSTNFPAGNSLITGCSPGVSYTVATAATSFTTQVCLIGKQCNYQDVHLKDLTFEQCTNGDIAITGTVGVSIDGCACGWDVTVPQTGNVIDIRKSASGYLCSGVAVRDTTTRLYPGGSNYSFYADTNCVSITLDNFLGTWGTPPVISSPAAQTTIITPQQANTSTSPVSSFPAVAIGGLSGATAASRYVGATANGHPASGTFAVGDFTVDQTGSIWICTTGGAVGSGAAFAQLTTAAAFATANDPMKIGFTSTYISPNPVTTNTFAAANAAAYLRLRSGGNTISNLTIQVVTSSGNISVGAYTNSGTGASAQPTGGRLATTGAVACPAAGTDVIALGSSITPNLGDWAGISCDNTTATVSCMGSGSNTGMTSGIAYSQGTAHPIPSTPSGLSPAFYTAALMKGS
jgi:hypothetical protein